MIVYHFHCSSKIGVVFFSMFAVNTGGLEEPVVIQLMMQELEKSIA